jgi:dolichyl-phosphate-mannose--protein O-mannosyl transferase
VPFLCAALGVTAAWAWERTATRVAAGVAGVVVVASFAFFAPVLYAVPLEPDAWRTRMVLADCERPDGTNPALPDDTTSSGSPPGGWCWI